MKKINIIEIVSFMYSCLYLYTGVSKLRNYELSVEQNTMMPLIGPYTEVISWLLPVIEIMIAIILIIPLTKIKGLFFATILMIFFTGYVGYIMTSNNHLPCTCGGFLQKLSWKQHLILNTSFVLFGLIALSLARMSRKKIEKTNFSYQN